jgi:hypothetical protein
MGKNKKKKQNILISFNTISHLNFVNYEQLSKQKSTAETILRDRILPAGRPEWVTPIC